MTTPLIMLGILAVPLLIVWSLRLRGLEVSFRAGGVISLTLLLLFTASGHFLAPEPMAEMQPPLVSQRLALIYLTGLLEIALALGTAGWLDLVVRGARRRASACNRRAAARAAGAGLTGSRLTISALEGLPVPAVGWVSPGPSRG